MTLILFLTVLFTAASVAGDDTSVMLQLRNGLYPKPTSWVATDHYCVWDGVECDSGNRVVSISMPSQSLSGTLPPNITTLTQLTFLSLQRNNLSGSIPFLGHLPLLQHVSLDHNQFTSVPSHCFSSLPSLTTLSLTNNPRLTRWFFPSELLPEGRVSVLVYLGATRTNLHGSLPDYFDSFPFLKQVRLSHNSLVGSLPQTFMSSGIEVLRLDNQASGLTGSVEVVSEMGALTQLWLHSNQLSGPIPDLSKCVFLWDINLADNLLTGSVPSTLLTWLTSLQNVSLENNLLQGPLPVFQSSNRTTKSATFGGNSFCKTTSGPCDPQVTTLLMVAEGLGYPLILAQTWKGNDACANWRFITCSDNKVVTGVDFHGRHFGGVISPFVANLTYLQNLSLSSNNLVGSIPKGLANLSELHYLDVSHNNLSGVVPKFPAYVRVNVDDNPQLSRSTPSPPSIGESPSWSTSTIVGVLMAGVVAVAALFALAYYLGRRKKMKENAREIEIGFGGEAAKYSLQVLKNATGDFDEANLLGKGGFSSVYRGEMEDKTMVAVKKMEKKRRGRLDAKALKAFKVEISALNEVRHPNVIELLGYYEDEQHLMLVYEYLPQGTLARHLLYWRENELQPLSLERRLSIALDIAKGVEHIHKSPHKLVHRDLKPDNILLRDNFRAVIADFGLVRLYSSTDRHSSSSPSEPMGTPGYWAPEGVRGIVTDKADVYSFGVILMELLTGIFVTGSTQWSNNAVNLVDWFRKVMIQHGDPPIIRPFDEATLIRVVDSHIRSRVERIASCFNVVAQLAIHCTESNHQTRPSMDTVVVELGKLVAPPWDPPAPEVPDNVSADLVQEWESILMEIGEPSNSDQHADEEKLKEDESIHMKEFGEPSNSNKHTDGEKLKEDEHTDGEKLKDEHTDGEKLKDEHTNGSKSEDDANTDGENLKEDVHTDGRKSEDDAKH